MGYELQGRMAEVCSCKTFCPCTAGQPPDNDRCSFNWVFHFDEGEINGVDVAGQNVAFVGVLEGSVVDGTVRAAVFIDETASSDQETVMLDAFTGKAGGPLADLASLVGEVVAVQRRPIEFDVHQGTGRFGTVGVFAAEIEGLRSPDGQPTRLTNFALSPVLGATAYPALPTHHELHAAEHGFDFTVNSGELFEFHYQAA